MPCCTFSEIHSSFVRILLRIYRALLQKYRALLRKYRALLRKYRALLRGFQGYRNDCVTWLHAPLHFLGNSELFCAFTIEIIQGSFVETQGSFEEI